MNVSILKNLLFYSLLFIIKKIIFEIKFFIKDILNQIIYRKKINSFEKFIRENFKYWDNKKKYNSKKKILISNFISTPGDTMTNCIIGKYLEEKYQMSLVGLSNKKKTVINLLNSYNIKNNIFFEKKNLFFKINIFFKSAFFLHKINSLKNLYKFQLNRVYIGKIVIDHIARHTGENHIKDLDFKVFYHFYEALYAHYSFRDIIKKQNIKIVIQSETQFIPCGIIFQNCLTNNIRLFAREGAPNWISNTIYSKKNEIYTARDEIEKNLFDFIKKNFPKKASKEGFEIIKNRFNKKDHINNWLVTTKKSKKKRITEYSKKKLCKIFSWDENKKIVCIFSHTLTDGNFVMGKRLFKSNLKWLQTTFKYMAQNKSVNFLVKPHPQELDYNTTTNTIKELDKFKDLKHIRLTPKNISQKSLSKIIDGMISSHGTAPLEYACYGVPSLIAGRSKFNYLNFFSLPKKISIYKKKIFTLQKITKLNNSQINDAKIFTYLIYKLIKIKCPLIPYFRWSDSWFNYSNKFWEVDCLDLLKKYDENKDYFKKMLFYQIDNNKRNMINLKLINKTKIN